MHKFKTTALTSTALLFAPLMPAFAAGTAPNTSIVNTATVTYKVGNVDQTPKTATDTFVVDRKIIVLTEKAADAAVSPLQQNAFVVFKVTNSSNDAVQYSYAANLQSQSATGTVGTLTPEVVTDATGTTPAANQTPTLSTDGSVFVRVRTNIGDVANGATAVVGLTATSLTLATGAGAVNGKTTVETVYADTAGPVTGDAIGDGKHSALATFTVSAAALTLLKTSSIITDAFGAADPNGKAIPGATVLYCIRVANGGGAQATSVVLSDAIPTTLTLLAGTLKSGATAVAGPPSSCTEGTVVIADEDGTATGVKYTVGTLAANANQTVSFRATIK